nr:reverse transcriptase domain-containing protein [Tanacetum cinerariifolium]
MPNPEDITDATTAMNMALALMAKAFKLNYSTPTNNNQRISSNPRNRQIAQPECRESEWVQCCTECQESGNANQNLNMNGNLVAARAEGNAAGHNGNQIRCYNYKGVGHFARNCMQASTSGTQTDKAPVYDSDGSAEGHNYENCDDNEIFNMFTQEEHVEQSGEIVEQHSANFEETRALYDSLYQNLAIEVEKVNSDENFPIVNQADARVQNFEIQFLKEAAKFVGDFESLAKEADESLAKHKTLELEIECLLRAVENEYAKLWNDWYKKCDECKYDKISHDKAYKDMQQKIERLQAQLGDLKGKSKVTSCVSDTRNPLSQKLESENVELEFQVSDQKDNTRDTSANTKFAKQSIVENLPKVDKTHALTKPVTSNSVSTPQESKVVKNDKQALGQNRSLFHNILVITKKYVNSDSNGFSSTGIDNTKTRRLQPRSNTKNDRVPSASKSSHSKNKGAEVKEHHRNLLLSKNTKHMSSACNNIKLDSQNVISKVFYAMCKQCLISVNHDFMGTVRFENDHVAAILGFGDLQWGNILITRVYFVEGLGHNLFSVGQLYDSDLEVAFRRNACFVRNLEGVDLLKRDCSTNLYTINLHEMASASPICLMARASSTKSWLWHQRLSHLNFDTINDLARNDLVSDLPKFKYNKEHLFPFLAMCYPKNDREDIGKLGAKGELDLLFKAMYDDYIGGQPSDSARTVPPAQEPQVLTSHDVDELNLNVMVDGNTFVNPFAYPSTSAAESSSSQNVDPSNMHTFYHQYPYEFQWTKDHPLEQVIGEPSRPILTRNQLRSDGDMCILADKQSGQPSGLLPSNTQPNLKGSSSKPYQPPQARNEHVNVVFTRSAENMLVEVGKLTFPADFVILEMEEYSKVPLILGRPFLYTADAVIQVKRKQLNLGVRTKRMIFHIDFVMKHSYSNDDTCFSIDVIDEILEEYFDALLDEGSKIPHSIEGTILEEKLFAEFDEFMAMTTEENSESKSDIKEPPFKKITFNTDYKIKTSIEEPPMDLEIKPLPDNLECVFLEEPSFLPVIISSQLSEENKKYPRVHS